VGIVPIARNIARQLGPNFTFDLFRDLFENYGNNEAPPELIESDDVINMLDLKADHRIPWQTDHLMNGFCFGSRGSEKICQNLE